MTDTEYGAYPSRDELAARLRAHHERLLSEAGDMPKNTARNKLETTLKIYMNPFVEEADATTEHAPFQSAAVTYLTMCRQHVLQMMPVERREPLAEELAELERLVLAYRQAEQGSAQTLVHSVRDLTGCIDRLQGALAGKLEDIRGELSSISTALQPVSAVAEGNDNLGRQLAHLDYVLTGSMALLVGPLPKPPPQPPGNNVTARPEAGDRAMPVAERVPEGVSHAS
jgi:hypothetical protein